VQPWDVDDCKAVARLKFLEKVLYQAVPLLQGSWTSPFYRKEVHFIFSSYWRITASHKLLNQLHCASVAQPWAST
jgi:hypothetical protein